MIELPIIALTGAPTSDTGVIMVWASTTRAGTQVDRMAIPTINTALIPTASKDAFNAGSPATDVADFLATAEATTQGLRDAVDAAFDIPVDPQDGGPLGDVRSADVAAALIPDIVRIDFSMPLAFPNGRQLEDDVIDTALGIVLNRGGAAGVSDAIGANDRVFSGTFPYLASHWLPAGAGGFGGSITLGVNLTTFGGGTLAQLEADASAVGGSVVATTVGGEYVVWVIGEPPFVNDTFATTHVGGFLAGTPMLLVA